MENKFLIDFDFVVCIYINLNVTQYDDHLLLVTLFSPLK